MDSKGADKIEVEALQWRYNWLSVFAADKGCVVSGKMADAPKQDAPEAKAMQEEIDRLRQELKEKVDTSGGSTQ